MEELNADQEIDIFVQMASSKGGFINFARTIKAYINIYKI